MADLGLSDYEILVLRHLAGQNVEPPLPGAAYNQALETLRARGFILTLGDSHYLSNAGKSTLRWLDEGGRAVA